MDEKQFVNCSQCDNPLSPQALSCPKCGHPIRIYYGFEWKSPQQIGRWPLIHIAFGRDKKTGRFMVAKGVIAIGQFGVGLITVAQFGVGLLFGFGQFMAGATAVAQIALTYAFGIGQLAA
ncbi:MAG: zinc ribbon domain-containing protein, partial [Candidatus Omnitrophota bacterium]